MTSKNNNKDPLEKFIKDKVRDYDITYNEEDWTELEGRLDVLDKSRAHKIRLRWVVAAGFLFVALLSYVIAHNYMKINQISHQLSDKTVKKEQTDTERTPLAGKKDSGDLKQNEEKSAFTAIKPATRNASPPLQGKEIISDKTKQGRTHSESRQKSSMLATTNKPVSKLITSLPACTECTIPKGALDEQEAILSAVVPPKQIHHATKPVSRAPATYTVNGSKGLQQIFSQISVGLIASPDLSTAGSISDFSNPGYKFGLTVEYKINSNLAIRTGIVSSKVLYKANRNDYSPPYGFWTNGIAADKTRADCTFLDIPVNLKYDFLNLTRSSFYASAGFSSYIMLNENYQFTYDSNQPGLARSWNGHTGTSYWLSNATVSVGYEFKIQSNWSLRAEPYLNIPLKGVGWGNVDLYSLGTILSLNYNL